MGLFNILFVIVSLTTVIDAQCAASDHPSCSTWVKTGFCVNPFYTMSQIQQYCPKSCFNNGCPKQITCASAISKGFESVVNRDCGAGYEVDTTGAKCCPIVDYMNPIWNYGPSIGGLCMIGPPAVMVKVPGGSTGGDCIGLDSVPGVCPVASRQGPCPNGVGCTNGYTCFKKAEVCCPTR